MARAKGCGGSNLRLSGGRGDEDSRGLDIKQRQRRDIGAQRCDVPEGV